METPTQAAAARRRIPPGPRGRPVVGSRFDFLHNSLPFITDVAQRYGDVAQYRMVRWSWYQINHPDGVQRVLQENNHNYTKGVMTLGIITPVLGDGLFTSEGALWLHQRRLMQPMFHRRRITAFGTIMTDATHNMFDRWQPAIDAGKPLDMLSEMSHLTMNIVTAALFSTHLNADSSAVSEAVTTLVDDIGYRFEVPLYPPPQVPTPRNRRRNQSLHTLDQAMYRIIEERRHGHAEHDDLLGLLMAATDEETGRGMSNKQLRDEVATLFGAGHETTAVTLTWAWYLLHQHPAVLARLRAELDAVLGGRPPTVADLPNLPYTRMVIDETLRLYPPAWITNRQAVADDEICGYHIPANVFVLLSPYVLHRHPAWWNEPERFDPERFLPERSANRPRYAYFPFGGGPRQCIGQGFALTEAALILATVAQQYDLRLAPNHQVEAQALATLRPRGGLPMRIVKRKA